jgi:hypothetical protein
MREWWLMVLVGLWLCALPVRLWLQPLPIILQRMALPRGRQPPHGTLEMERAVGLVVRLCQVRLFRGRIFPRACLRQSLTLYYALTRLGYPAAIHVGVRKEGAHLQAHSWVTVQGKPVAERRPMVAFTTIYSFDSTVECPTVETSVKR